MVGDLIGFGPGLIILLVFKIAQRIVGGPCLVIKCGKRKNLDRRMSAFQLVTGEILGVLRLRATQWRDRRSTDKWCL